MQPDKASCTRFPFSLSGNFLKSKTSPFFIFPLPDFRFLISGNWQGLRDRSFLIWLIEDRNVFSLPFRWFILFLEKGNNAKEARPELAISGKTSIWSVCFSTARISVSKTWIVLGNFMAFVEEA